MSDVLEKKRSDERASLLNIGDNLSLDDPATMLFGVTSGVLALPLNDLSGRRGND